MDFIIGAIFGVIILMLGIAIGQVTSKKENS